jgi:hypothetical protein
MVNIMLRKVTIYIVSFIVSSNFAPFALSIAGFGALVTWLFSPQHAIVIGIRQLPIFVWPVIVFVPMMTFALNVDVPYSLKLILALCSLILLVGVAILSQKIFKW